MISEPSRMCHELRECTFCEFQHVCRFDHREHRQWLLGQRLGAIRRRVLVMSNKGGVGKSTVTVNLAAALAAIGLRVGVIDADLAGPSVPHLFGLQEAPVRSGPTGLVPPEAAGVKVFSIGFTDNGDGAQALRTHSDGRQDMLAAVLGGVGWGALDLLLVDMPSGTGAELVGLAEIDRELFGCVLVTTPHTLTHANTRRAVRALDDLDLPLLGVVENMSGMHSDHPGVTTSPYAGAMFAASIGAPLLGQIPFDVSAAEAAERGEPVIRWAPASAAGRNLKTTAEALVARLAL
jgi:ATP-binding protein involved in chromosome partitioning